MKTYCIVNGKKETLSHLGEEFLRGAIVSDRFLIGRGDCDSHVAGGVKVVLISQNLTRVFNLFAWVPFCRNRKLESFSNVWQEVCVCLWLSKNVGCICI